jgi:hypothetical protein
MLLGELRTLLVGAHDALQVTLAHMASSLARDAVHRRNSTIRSAASTH